MAEQEPRVLGDRYEIHQRLARGGMAQVYLARDRSLDRPVAVKELVPEFATDPSFVERFRREAQAAANLSHPNIVGVYDWGTQDGTYFIVMEYVDGPSLSQVIRRDGPLHPRRAAELAGEVAAALGFAHSRGVVHRDVKPGNVLLTATGQSKVTDFGIARALSSPDDDLTQAGSVMGTATYFSPEQAQGLPVDPRSDLYSLGVVLYEMVTGRPPFSGDTPLAIAYKHVQDQPAPPSTIVPEVPRGLEADHHEAPPEASRRPLPVGRGAAGGSQPLPRRRSHRRRAGPHRHRGRRGRSRCGSGRRRRRGHHRATGGRSRHGAADRRRRRSARRRPEVADRALRRGHRRAARHPGRTAVLVRQQPAVRHRRPSPP
ncbi:MAG: protein kinase [Microthrixaceae bacterium]